MAVSKTFRRPALSHALWLLVLLKLITPPLFTIPLHFLPPPQEPVHHPVPMPAAQTKNRPAPIQVASAEPIFENVQLSEDDRPLQLLPAPTPTVESQPPTRPSITLPTILLSIWLAGSTVCLLIITLRLRQFSNLLRFASVAPPQIQILARTLAARLNLSLSPPVHFIPGPL